MARTSISIPDDLKNALEPYKSRINISAVCSQALRRAVETERLLEEHSQGLHEAISRLRAQRLEADADSKKAGYRSGATWILRDATYADTKWFTQEVASRAEEGERACDIIASERPDMDPEQSDPLTALGNGHDPFEFWTGFLQAVLDIWAQIEDAVDGDDA